MHSTVDNSSFSRLPCLSVLVLVLVSLLCHLATGFPVPESLPNNAILLLPGPKDQARVFRPCEDHRAILKFVSHTSNSWERMFDFRRYTRLSLRLIWSLQGLQQSLSESWDNPDRQCCAVLPKRLRCPVRASLFPDQRLSGPTNSGQI